MIRWLLDHELRYVKWIILAAVLLLGGCATTTIETPIGRYTSSRNSAVDHLYIKITKLPDGTEVTEVIVGGASGDASTVIDAQAAMLRAAILAAFEAGLKGVVPGG